MNHTANFAKTTGTTARIDDASAPASFGLLALNVAVVVFVIVGFIVATLTLAGGGRTAPRDHDGSDGAGNGVGVAADTSFGSIFVEHVETLEGLSEEQLGGMTHGIADLVEEDEAQVSIAVLLTNSSKHTIDVQTGDYAIFVDGREDPIPPSSSTVQPLSLAPGSSVDATITFVVPRAGAELSLGYADPDGAAVIVPIGSVDRAPLGDPTNGHSTASDDNQNHDD